MNGKYGMNKRGSFWEDENGSKLYFPEKNWDWRYKSNYKRQDKKDELRKKLYGNMTTQTTKHEYFDLISRND